MHPIRGWSRKVKRTDPFALSPQLMLGKTGESKLSLTH